MRRAKNGGTLKRTLFAIAGLALAALAAAQLAKYKDWAKSPEAYLLTPEERADWSKVTSDADAEKFIAGYWARRGGERFKEEIQRRIAAADEQFKLRRQRGSESWRGRLLVALGSPSRVSQARVQEQESPPPGTPPGSIDTRPDAGSPFGSSSLAVAQTWVYDKDKFDPSWGIGELRVRIIVDPQRGADELQGASAVERAIAKVAEKSIVNPSAMVSAGPAPAGAPPAVAPKVPAVAGTGPGPAPGAAPAIAGAALPAATRASLEALLKEKTEGPGFWGGPFHAVTGDPFYAFQFYLPGEKAPAVPVKFGGLVTSESGGEPATYWEDASFSDMKTGAKSDKVYERSVVLPPGSYHAALGLFSSDGGSALQSASVSFKLDAKPAEFDVSPLVLTNELKPLTKRPAPTDPFVFGVEKPIKVEPKADRTFSRGDVQVEGVRRPDGSVLAKKVLIQAAETPRVEVRGTLETVDSNKKSFVVVTPSGKVTVETDASTQFLGHGQTPATFSDLRPDSLWYFYAVTNPKLPESSGAEASAGKASGAAPPPPATPGSAGPTAAAAGAQAAKPRIMQRIGVLRDGKPAFAPFTGPAEMQMLAPNYYASGSEIPLATFDPGYYTFTLNLRDLNAPRDSAAFKGVDRQADFVVLKPDGSLPEKTAPRPVATPTPRPKPMK
jgi:GWxTD domain-containing protein